MITKREKHRITKRKQCKKRKIIKCKKHKIRHRAFGADGVLGACWSWPCWHIYILHFSVFTLLLLMLCVGFWCLGYLCFLIVNKRDPPSVPGSGPPPATRFRSWRPYFFGLVFRQVFGSLLDRFWLHFGSLWATILPPKIDQKNNRISGRFLEAFWPHCSEDVLQLWDLFWYHFWTFVKKAEPTSSPPLPMKSEVRALTNDIKIDPKSDQNLDKNGVEMFIDFLMLFLSLWALILAPFWHPKRLKKWIKNQWNL